MALYDYDKRIVSFKIVYYGPGLGGKTSNLTYLHGCVKQTMSSKLISIDTASDRTLFFDFLPLTIEEISGFKVRAHLYTVPGQVFYDGIRQVVLRGADAIVFVADSQIDRRADNLASLKNLFENLQYNRLDASVMPIVLQLNKRDLPNILSIDEMQEDLNKAGYPVFPAVATEGTGVKESLDATLAALTRQLETRAKQQPLVHQQANRQPIRRREQAAFPAISSPVDSMPASAVAQSRDDVSVPAVRTGDNGARQEQLASLASCTAQLIARSVELRECFEKFEKQLNTFCNELNNDALGFDHRKTAT